jgi:5-methylcytosine-specific restriction enzyme subunit McrC
MEPIVVREFARLTTSPLDVSGLDEARVPESAFDWLCQESARLRVSGANLVQVESRRWLRLDNYVGVIQTPCGTRIEVLPKTTDRIEGAAKARQLLKTMLAKCLDLPVRQTSTTAIQTFDTPLTEWVMREFLEALDRLVKRGVRFDYHSVREEEPFLRGRLDLNRQLRQPPGRQHLFQIEYDIFDADRPENRLLRSALERIFRFTRDGRNWRLSRELSVLLAPIPLSADIDSDFRRWQSTRLLSHYQGVRPWCSLILNEKTPLSVLGDWKGPSLLFPMEKVFERYVETCLRSQLPTDARLRRTASTEYLCSHRGARWFNLQPDLMVERGGARIVLDTKWKRLDSSRDDAEYKYGLSQADFYQLFAYGHKYQDGVGDLILIYPETEAFSESLPMFEMTNDMRLWVVPFSVRTGRLVGIDIETLIGLTEPLKRHEALVI